MVWGKCGEIATSFMPSSPARPLWVRPRMLWLIERGDLATWEPEYLGPHFDPDGDSLTYAWALTAKPVASAATIASPTSAVTTFSPDVAGSYTFCLTVTDSHGLSSGPVCASLRASGIPVP